MAKITPKQVKAKKSPSSSSSSGLESLMNKIPKGDGELLFDKTNYILMIVGVLFVIVGFILMSGGGSHDPNVFDTHEIYSTRRITIAPIVIIVGFIIEIAAILKRPSSES